ncbi:class I SAM-dependent methyltransferase [Streptomyces sp. NPDC020983]|uniref:class I SAM-dependent methyltransferase n=1 Tax=Streptomyces sp. NPDC020983 TaxID=3365106 RepID=UPI0037BB56A2
MTRAKEFRDAVVRARFEAIAGEYDATVVRRRLRYNDAVDTLVGEWVPPRPDGAALEVLDAACGTGTRWGRLATRLPAARACGLDMSRNMCALAERNGGFAQVVNAPLTGMPFPDARFDLVVCLFFSFCYLTSQAERQQALREMHRVLKPGGRLVIDAINILHRGEPAGYRRSLPGTWWDVGKSLVDPRLEPADKLYTTRNGGRRLRGYFHGFTHRTFRSLIESAGIGVDRQLTVGYHSGELRSRPHEGQLLMLCSRPLPAPAPAPRHEGEWSR